MLKNSKCLSTIGDEEILDAVKKLKNNKADEVLNEHISATVYLFLHLYYKLFNIIFDSDFISDEWLIGIVKPVYYI